MLMHAKQKIRTRFATLICLSVFLCEASCSWDREIDITETKSQSIVDLETLEKRFGKDAILGRSSTRVIQTADDWFTISRYPFVRLEITDGINDEPFIAIRIAIDQPASQGNAFLYNHSILSKETGIRIRGVKFFAAHTAETKSPAMDKWSN